MSTDAAFLRHFTEHSPLELSVFSAPPIETVTPRPGGYATASRSQRPSDNCPAMAAAHRSAPIAIALAVRLITARLAANIAAPAHRVIIESAPALSAFSLCDPRTTLQDVDRRNCS